MLSRMISGKVSVYIAVGVTDLRKSISSLSILVEQEFDLNPFSGSLFVFCNRRRNLLKLLYWEHNGFCLWVKRLEQDRFRWPDADCGILEIGVRELNWLLDGLSVEQRRAYNKLEYSIVA